MSHLRVHVGTEREALARASVFVAKPRFRVSILIAMLTSFPSKTHLNIHIFILVAHRHARCFVHRLHHVTG